MWCEMNVDQDASLMEEQPFSCLSSQLIPYPLMDDLPTVHDAHESGEWKFPEELVPKYNDSLKCEHGHKFNSYDPVRNSWVSSKDIIIHRDQYQYVTLKGVVTTDHLLELSIVSRNMMDNIIYY